MVGRHLQLVAQMRLEDLATLVGVGAVEADHDRCVDLTRPSAVDDAVGHLFAAGDATEDVDEDRLHAGSLLMTSSAPPSLVGVRAAADVEEVGGLAAGLVDDVERAHRQAGAVGDDADGPVEADVLQALVVGGLLALVALLRGLVRLVLGVAEGRCRRG
jgi:hypothetical protein